ncbi:MAG: PAS domain S-box protein [Bacteroidota bacterium]|nr:PAS domain S-box protein [Bacteroidota bacterium]
MKNLPNILIVDDNEVNLELLEAIVSKTKINWIKALSGEVALEKVRGIELALAIIDVRMPIMDGFKLAKKLNQKRFADKVPIIFLTAARSNENDEFEGYDSGAVDYLYKPINIRVLMSKINVFIDLYNQKQTIIREAAKLQKTTDELSWTNDALKKSEAKYRSYIESAPDGVFVTDEKGKYIEVNEAACRITGYSKEMLLTMSISDLLPDDVKESGIADFRKLVETGILIKADLPFCHKTGIRRWWNLEAVKLAETRYLGFVKDITTRIEQENSLKAYQLELEMQNDEITKAKNQADIVSTKYSHLYDFAPSGYFTLSTEKTIKELNYSGASILGKDRSLLIDNLFESFISSNSLPKFNDFFLNIQKLKTRQTCDLVLLTVDNQLKNVHIEGFVDANNEQILLNVSDISELKKIEKVLKESEEKYRTMLNASPDGILLIDLNGVISEISEIGIELLSANNKDEIIGNNFSLFVPPHEKKMLKKIYETTMSEGICQNIEMQIKKKNKALFLGDISATLIQDVDGKPVLFMIIIRDISFQKEIETKQIHADRMANLGQMASGIAHEINQPLNNISMVMDKILFDAAKSGNVEFEFLKNRSEKIFENITRISNIIDHVRIFSRSHDNYISTAFDINTTIENACSMLTEQFKHLQINLALELDRQIPRLIGNSHKFEQVIINLLVNAKDAVIERAGQQKDYSDLRIGIRTSQEDQFLVAEIIDNGIGIDNEIIQKVMLPFFTTKEEGKGTGLGLSICYQIVKEMNGTIVVSSERYIGTKIKLIFDTKGNIRK